MVVIVEMFYTLIFFLIVETLCQLLLDLDVIKLLALLISIEKNTDVLNMSLKALSVLLEAGMNFKSC